MRGYRRAVAVSAIAFDAFGTLFDLGALRVRCEQALGTRGGAVFDGFQRRLVPLTWHATASGHYRPFPEIAALALRSAAREQGAPLDDRGAHEIAQGLASLSAFADAGEALEALAAHHPLAILSNGTAEGIRALADGAGLTVRFDHLLDADSVGRFKPAPEVYALAPRAFGRPAEDVLLVSGNEWDVAGAKQSGLRGAWIARGRPATGFLGVEPDVVVDQLADLPEALARR